jgi:hypothetical protein
MSKPMSQAAAEVAYTTELQDLARQDPNLADAALAELGYMRVGKALATFILRTERAKAEAVASGPAEG